MEYRGLRITSFDQPHFQCWPSSRRMGEAGQRYIDGLDGGTKVRNDLDGANHHGTSVAPLWQRDEHMVSTIVLIEQCSRKDPAIDLIV